MNAHLFENLHKKWVYQSYIFNVFEKTGFGIKWSAWIDMLYNQTKQIIYIWYVCIKKQSKVGDQNALFSIATTPRCRGGRIGEHSTH